MGVLLICKEEETHLRRIMHKFYGVDRVFELIPGPESIRDLRGVCLFIIRFISDYQQKNPLKYPVHATTCLFLLFECELKWVRQP